MCHAAVCFCQRLCSLQRVMAACNVCLRKCSIQYVCAQMQHNCGITPMCVRTCMHACVHACVHVRTCMRACVHVGVRVCAPMQAEGSEVQQQSRAEHHWM